MYISKEELKDYVIKGIICIVVLGVVFFLIKENIFIANLLCKRLDIPKDLSITVISPGFFIEVIILLSVLEFGIIYYCYSYIKLFIEK